MANTVFFAWQLDTPSEGNKTFIWSAIQKAASDCANETQPEMSPRPERDTQGLAGTPNIVETIFRRIRECSMFVADVSFVATTAAGKKIPNPNVMLELGFAVRSIGWERTVLVFNDAHGSQAELPFDILQHRWPIEYRITKETQARDRRFASLSDALAAAIKDCEAYTLDRANEMAQALDTSCLAIVARHETDADIPLPMPATTMGQLLEELRFGGAIRRLLDLGAIRVIAEPNNVAYSWTYDGRRMIDELKKLHPRILSVFRTPVQ